MFRIPTRTFPVRERDRCYNDGDEHRYSNRSSPMSHPKISSIDDIFKTSSREDIFKTAAIAVIFIL
jgi:hypothetical protein